MMANEKDITISRIVPVGEEVDPEQQGQPPKTVSADVDPFDSGEGDVRFRTQGWVATCLFMLKMTFSTGVLSIPTAYYTLGLINGLVMTIIFGCINTYMAHLMGRFKLAHPGVHALPDTIPVMCSVWGINKRLTSIALWYTEAIVLFTWILACGINMLGFAIALNAVSSHATCSVVFGVVSYLTISGFSSIRKMSHLAWLTWTGLITVVIAVMIVVIAVSLLERPAAAPATGPFVLGFSPFPAPTTTFTTGLSATLNIFVSSGNTPGYIPVQSEMRNPKDYNKALFVCMGFINASYITIGTIMYYYCGQWVANPALGSAGPLIKKIAYGLAVPGLIAGAMTINHMAGKSLFVKVLRDSRHLTSNTKTHWAVWLGCTFGVGFLGWLLSAAIPFFGELLALIGCLCFGFTSILVPVLFWFNLRPKAPADQPRWKRRGSWSIHAAIFAIAVFVTVVGSYAVISTIVANFRSTNYGGPFSCADNSNTVAATS